MRVVSSRSELVVLVGKIQNIVPTRPVVPVCANALVEAYNGELIISTIDLMVGMRAKMEANVLEEGAIVLPARRFFQLIRELTTREVELSISNDEVVSIQAGDSQFCLNGMSKMGFPTFPDLADTMQFSVPSDKLREVLSKSAFAAAREDSRHVLNGVLMMVDNDEITFVGTDGKRLARVSTFIELKHPHKHDYLIPLKAVEEIIRGVGDGETVRVRLAPDRIGIESGCVLLITKLLSGEYPDIDGIIPKEHRFTLTLHREELMTLLKQVALFTTDRSRSVCCTLTPGELTLVARADGIGEGRVSMPVDYSGETFEIAFNPFFFQDILRHSTDDTVSLSLTTPCNPGLVTDSTSAHYIIMPMSLHPT